MKNLSSVFVFIFSLILCSTSCKKDAIVLTNTDLLTQHIWKLDNSSISADCEMDDRHTFANTGTYITDPGTDLCHSEETATAGTFTIQFPAFTTSAAILRLT